jgi:alpha-L-arabinofuranosidase
MSGQELVHPERRRHPQAICVRHEADRRSESPLGGCFADGYHWRDGIGKAAARPRTYNFWQRRMPAEVDATETNQFGIHEFMQLCRLIGAEPYLAANVGSGTPKEFHDWVSYCKLRLEP